MWSGGHMYPATLCTSSVGKIWCVVMLSEVCASASASHHACRLKFYFELQPLFSFSDGVSQAKLRDAAALIQEWCSILHKISLFCNIVSNTPFGSYSKRQTDWTIFWLHILHIFTTREAFSMYTPCDQIYMRGKRNGKGWRRGRQALEFSSNLSTTSQHFWEVHNP